MSWGTDFTADVFLSHKSFDNEHQVKDVIENCQENIVRAEQLLTMMCSSTPKHIVPSDWKDDILLWLQNQSREQIEVIKEESLHLFKLNLYYELLLERKSSVDLNATDLSHDSVSDVVVTDAPQLV